MHPSTFGGAGFLLVVSFLMGGCQSHHHPAPAPSPPPSSLSAPDLSGYAEVSVNDYLINEPYTRPVPRLCGFFGFVMGGRRLDGPR
jgi:hypothetical protein